MNKLEYLLTLQADRFNSALSSVQSGVGKTTSFLERHLGALAAIGGASVSVAGMVEGLKNAFDMGESLAKFSTMTGQTLRDSAILKTAFKGIGMDVEEAAGMFAIMQRSLAGTNEAGQPTKGIFDRLGPSVDKLKTMSGPEQLKAISEALRKLPEGAVRGQAAMEIFGRSGARMLEMVNKPELLSGKLSASAELLAKNAAVFENVSRSLEKAGAIFKGFFIGLAAGVAPVLQPILDKINAMDFSAWGVKVGNVLNAAVGAFKAGELSDLLGKGFKVAALELQGPLLSAVNVAVAAFTAGIVEAAHQAALLLSQGIEGTINRLAAYNAGKWIDADVKHMQENHAAVGGQLAAGAKISDLSNIPNMAGVHTENTEAVKRLWAAAESQVGSYQDFADKEMARRRSGGPGVPPINANQMGEKYLDALVERMQKASGAAFGRVAIDPAEIVKNVMASSAAVALEAITAGKNAPGAGAENATEIAAAWNDLKASIAAFKTKSTSAEEGKKNSEAGAGSNSEHVVKRTEADRMTQIGGFVNAGANAVATDFARRTWQNTTKANQIADLSQKLLQKLADQGIVVTVQDGYC